MGDIAVANSPDCGYRARGASMALARLVSQITPLDATPYGPFRYTEGDGATVATRRLNLRPRPGGYLIAGSNNDNGCDMRRCWERDYLEGERYATINRAVS